MTIQNSTSSEEYGERNKPCNRNFYSGASRGEIVDKILQAMENLTPFITLTGEEGLGKTVVVETVIKRIPQHIVVADMPAGVQSFDEILHVIAQELGIILPEHKDRKVLNSVIDLIRQNLEDGGLKLLVVFDSAELLYLATLERALKTFDRMNEDSTLVTLLLAGRPALTEHLHQLSTVNVGSHDEKHFTLPSLSAEETVEYLNFCFNHKEDSDQIPSFSYEAGGKVYAIAGGNIRMTNVVAEQILGKLSETGTTRIEADDVSETELEKTIEKNRSQANLLVKRNMMIAGGVVVGLLLLSLLVTGGKKEPEEIVVPSPPPQVQEVVPEPKTVEIVVEREKPAEETTDKIVSPLEEARAELAAIAKNVKAEKAKRKAEAKKQEVNDNEATAETAVAVKEKDTEVLADAAESEPLPVKKEVEEDITPKTKKVVAEVAKKVPEQKKEVPVVADTEVKKSVEKEAEKVAVVEKDGLDTKKTKSAVKIAPVQVSGTDSTVIKDKYDERLVAGGDWLYGDADDKFTVQLMVLTSENAEENLRKMLLEDGYKDIADDMYILKKSDAETPLLVFYGEYATLSEARNARNTLPQILRKHHPYPISIAGAVEKAK